MSGPPDERFRALYDAHFRDVLRFALRRTPQPEDAADVVAETFTVVWRRLDRVPAGDEALPWLYAVCRKVLANHTRSAVRRDRLGARLRATLATRVVPDPAGDVTLRLSVNRAMDRLSPGDRELLRLTAWEGLAPHEIAVVLGIPARTARTRLSRARARLRAELGPFSERDVYTDGGHVLDVPGAPLPQPAPGKGR